MVSLKFWYFLHPLSRISQNLSVLYARKIGKFSTPLSVQTSFMDGQQLDVWKSKYVQPAGMKIDAAGGEEIHRRARSEKCLVTSTKGRKKKIGGR